LSLIRPAAYLFGRSGGRNAGIRGGGYPRVVERHTVRSLYEECRPAVAYVEVYDSRTDTRGIGTAFHVGGGVFVTARHVIEGKRITRLGTRFPDFVEDSRGVHHDPGGTRYRATELLDFG